jgi:hypothetical protein
MLASLKTAIPNLEIRLPSGMSWGPGVIRMTRTAVKRKTLEHAHIHA